MLRGCRAHILRHAQLPAARKPASPHRCDWKRVWEAQACNISPGQRLSWPGSTCRPALVPPSTLPDRRIAMPSPWCVSSGSLFDSAKYHSCTRWSAHNAWTEQSVARAGAKAASPPCQRYADVECRRSACTERESAIHIVWLALCSQSACVPNHPGGE